MQNPPYLIFIILGCIWILIGAAAVIVLFKSSGQEVRFGKWGLIVAVPILLPLILALLYQIVRPLVLEHFL